MKLLLSTSIVLTSAVSFGQFKFYDLHPIGATSSKYTATYKGISVGSYAGTSGARAIVWTGESFIDVTPAPADCSARWVIDMSVGRT